LVKFINTNTNESSSKEYVEALLKQLTTLADICGLILTRKEEILDQEVLAYALINILMSNDWYEAMFKERYKLDSSINSMVEFQILDAVGRKRGALLKGDVVDTNKAAKILIEDYRTGKIGKISLE